MGAETMSAAGEIIMFDASTYPGFERAVATSKKPLVPSEKRNQGYVIVVIFIVMIPWLAISGWLPGGPFYSVAVLGALSLLPIAILISIFWLRVSSGVPVKLTENGMLLLGDRRWPSETISRLILYGGFGAVELKDQRDHTVAMIDRAQFGSFDDFLSALQRFQPDVKVEREYAPVKVRLAKER